MLCRSELETKNGASAEGITQLFEGLGVGRVLAALDPRPFGPARNESSRG
jgi:hypothetical protein